MTLDETSFVLGASRPLFQPKAVSHSPFVAIGKDSFTFVRHEPSGYAPPVARLALGWSALLE